MKIKLLVTMWVFVNLQFYKSIIYNFQTATAIMMTSLCVMVTNVI